ncbi:hypothetical protein STEG23_020731 [Scotinomys teguina]
MEPLKKNHTLSSEFIILGFGDLAELQILFFGLFLIMHLITLAGHTTIVLITLIDTCLQTPMYFFLRNLSAIEICYILVIVPNMLANFMSKNQRMPILGCALQMHLFIALGGAECFLLAAMAYDRFVAICNPLRYTLIITRVLCLQMLALACISGFTLSLTLTTLIFLLPFCQSHVINHFFCDIPAVLFLACSDTRANEIAVFLVCMLILLIPFLLILFSYGFIIAAILRIHSAEGRSKAFSTCAGHLLVSIMHYGCAIFIYIRPKSCYTPEQDKIVGGQTLTVFTESSSDKLSLEGIVVQRVEYRPAASENYMRLKRLQIEESSKPVRLSQQLDKVVTTNYKPVTNHQYNIEYERKKKEDGKQAQADKQHSLDMVFSAFEKHQYYNLKDLVDITKQPVGYLKEILKKIGIQNVKEIHKNTWELKPEYKHYQKEEKSD